MLVPPRLRRTLEATMIQHLGNHNFGNEPLAAAVKKVAAMARAFDQKLEADELHWVRYLMWLNFAFLLMLGMVEILPLRSSGVSVGGKTDYSRLTIGGALAEGFRSKL